MCFQNFKVCFYFKVYQIFISTLQEYKKSKKQYTYEQNIFYVMTNFLCKGFVDHD